MTRSTEETSAEAASTETGTITGRDLIAWGHAPGPAFTDLLHRAAEMTASGADAETIRRTLDALRPAPVVTMALHAPGTIPLFETLRAETPDEEANLDQVRETMRAVLRTPTVTAGAIMPDACPTGPIGTIPVGGVVATRNAIHPGMHSADICCSVMMTDLGEADPRAVLDAAQSVTHFGAGGRPNGRRFTLSPRLLDAFRANPFLDTPRILQAAQDQLGTQGDGNHFLFVGRSRQTGRVAMVTHHGSRGPGAMLYKAGMVVAERFRRVLSPQTLKQNAWIPADSEEGRAYWDALQLIRRWTKANHTALHQATVEAAGLDGTGARIWNEHNFVFRRGDLYLHGKGATPAWPGYAADASGLTLVPLNMAEPVLVVRGTDNAQALGFSPHGAGRNFSRSEHRRRLGDVTVEAQVAAETAGLDIRFAAGRPDLSELPSSYKNAASVVEQIRASGLAEIVDHIDPYGCLMAGEVPPPWKTRAKGRR